MSWTREEDGHLIHISTTGARPEVCIQSLRPQFPTKSFSDILVRIRFFSHALAIPGVPDSDVDFVRASLQEVSGAIAETIPATDLHPDEGPEDGPSVIFTDQVSAPEPRIRCRADLVPHRDDGEGCLEAGFPRRECCPCDECSGRAGPGMVR